MASSNQEIFIRQRREQALLLFSYRQIEHHYSYVTPFFLNSIGRVALDVYRDYKTALLEQLSPGTRQLLISPLPDSAPPVPAEHFVNLCQAVDAVVKPAALLPLGRRWGQGVKDHQLTANPVAEQVGQLLRVIPFRHRKMEQVLANACQEGNRAFGSLLCDYRVIDAHTYFVAISSTPRMQGRTQPGSWCYALGGLFEGLAHWGVSNQWQARELTCTSQNGTGLCIFAVTDERSSFASR